MEELRAVRSTFRTALMVLALVLLGSTAVLAQPPCEGDTSRTVFATGDGESGNACRQFSDQESCEQAYHIGGEGITTCYWDGGQSQCKGCGPDNEGDGLCVNTCRIDECAGATTLVFAGAFAGQSGGGCPQFTDEGSCETHYIYGGDGFASCYWDVEGGCRGCGSNNEGSGACVNLCRVNECAGNTNLVYRGPAFSGEQGGACRSAANQQDCESSFTFGDNGFASCYWDGGEGACFGCGPRNEQNGYCTNSCRVCAEDPGRTIFAGGPETRACRQFDNDPTSCEQAYAQSGEGLVVSCFSTTNCIPCGGGNTPVATGGATTAGIPSSPSCSNECIPPPTCADETRTDFTGGPFTGMSGGACRTYDGNQSACEAAYARQGDGTAVSCFYDTQSDVCLGCGYNNESSGNCTNTCIPPPPCADSTRTDFTGGPFTGMSGGACRSYDGNQSACETAYARQGDGTAVSCFYDTGEGVCLGCGYNNEFGEVACENTCRPTPTCDDTNRTDFVGGPFTGACHVYDGNQSACVQAYALNRNLDTVICIYDGDINQCQGCGPDNEAAGNCANTCRTNECEGDSSRTVFGGAFGGQSGGGCPQYTTSDDCEKAYIYGDDGFASCFWDENAEPQCRGCGGRNESDGLCINTCAPRPPCPNDSSRTIFTGGPDSEGCHRFDDDPDNCALAYNEGAGGVTSCYYQGGSCRGCGPDNLNNGSCENTCLPPTCPEAPDKTFGPCERFNDDPTMCGQAFEASEYGPISCVSVPACLGCGLNNQSDLRCSNTCEYGVPTPTPGFGTPTPTPRVDQPNGSTCMSDTECTSTNCEQGVCCATACDGVSERCDLPGTVGLCVGVAAAAPAVTPWGMILGLLALIAVAALGFRSMRAH